MNKSVLIANPLPHGKHYTSVERALDLCHMGLATMQDGALHYTLDAHRSMSADQEFNRNRGGVLYWNGPCRDPNALHRPGEVRSKCHGRPLTRARFPDAAS